MCFPIGNLLSIRYILLAGAQACQLFENDLMATCKRSKETNPSFIARSDLLSIFSSPEPKALGELIVWDSSGPPSVPSHFQT